MPATTLLIVFGSWILLLGLTILYYRRHRNGDDD
jgi:hypothetical protein